MDNSGNKELIRRALYVSNYEGDDFMKPPTCVYETFGLWFFLTDPYVWILSAKKSCVSDYYEYILLYTDDILIVSKIIKRLHRDLIESYFEWKKESIGFNKIYLGGTVIKLENDNGANAWDFILSQYVQLETNNVEDWLKGKDMKLTPKS